MRTYTELGNLEHGIFECGNVECSVKSSLHPMDSSQLLQNTGSRPKEEVKKDLGRESRPMSRGVGLRTGP